MDPTCISVIAEMTNRALVAETIALFTGFFVGLLAPRIGAIVREHRKQH